MKLSHIMSHDPLTVSPDQTMRQAAEIMRRIETGFLPVVEDDRPVGTVTDRDITIRGVAEGKGPETAIRDVMTRDVRYCHDDDDSADVARSMAEQKIRRMLVLDRDMRLVGLLSLGDLAVRDDGGRAASVLENVSQPGGPHV